MIDKQLLADFRKDFEETVKSLEQKYGLVISLGSIRYSPDSFEAKIECKEGESRDDVNEKEFKIYCKTYGLQPEDYDRRFAFQGKSYVIVGVRPSRRKYPICCQCVEDGKTYGFTASLVKKLLA